MAVGLDHYFIGLLVTRIFDLLVTRNRHPIGYGHYFLDLLATYIFLARDTRF